MRDDARNRLAPRREQRIEAGCFLGYRKMTADSAGTWLARSRDATTAKQIQSPLGEFGDHPALARFEHRQQSRPGRVRTPGPRWQGEGDQREGGLREFRHLLREHSTKALASLTL